MQVCTVCIHAQRTEIEQKLAESISLRQLAATYSLGYMALYRHSRHGSNPREKIAAKLTPRQARFVRELPKAPTIEQAMIRAGYSENSAKQGLAGVSQSKDVQAYFRSAIQGKISADTLADKIVEGLQAEDVRMFAHQGHVIDIKALPDHKTRLSYVELAVKFGGFFQEKLPTVTVEIDARPIEEKIAETRMILDELAKLGETGAREEIIDITPGD